MNTNTSTTSRAMLTLLLAAASGAAAQDYQLVWSDEFDGNALDTSSWEYQTGTGTAYGLPAGWGNDELQYYTNFNDNVSVSNGTLKITARRQNFGGRAYTSGRIRTLGKRDFLYGRFEARMKLPSTSGVWPAFWMLPTGSPYGGWASSGEIDIMESVNNADRIYGTIHHGANWPDNQAAGTSVANGTDYSLDFHDYAIEWEPDQMRWYLDGQLYLTLNRNQWWSNAAPSNPRAPFDNQFHMLLNVAVGGQFPGNPNGGAQYPQTLEVDYVRVYQILRGPFSGAPIQIPGVIEAEDFDSGFNGQSYNDTDGGNNGGAYRETDVDIETTSDGGHNIGWFVGGEWLEYTIDVQTSGTYNLATRVASLNTNGGSFRVEIDGQDLTGNIAVNSTGGWQSWVVLDNEIELSAGEHVLRFTNTSGAGGGFNLDRLTLTTNTPGCSDADIAEPYNSLDFFDLSAFLSGMANMDPASDINSDGNFDFFDLSVFLNVLNQGCP